METTFLVNNIFYNYTGKKKVFKICDDRGWIHQRLMERMALSHPEIAFKFINNRQTGCTHQAIIT